MYRKDKGFPKEDLSGKEYGYLTVISFSHINKFGRSMWNTVCKCGNKKISDSGSLKNGQTKSCGCMRKDLILPDGIAETNRLYASYRNGAHRRGLDFLLSKEEFSKLISGDCYYCGSAPSAISQRGSSKLVYNGIDRINNKIGYQVNNAVSCCKICNTAKSNMSYSDFIKWVRRISNNTKGLLRFGGKYADRVSISRSS